jgi:hypothetical protein
LAPQAVPSGQLGAQAGVVTQAIWTFETLAFETVPLPLVTPQLCLGAAGWVAIVTAYDVLLGCAGKTKLVAPRAIDNETAPFLILSQPPARPAIEPPTV